MDAQPKPLPVTPGSAYCAEEIEAYLAQSRIPLRLACLGGNGFPLVASHWFFYTAGVFHCAIHRNSHVAQRLRQDPRVGFEIAADTPPYRGIRGQGIAQLSSTNAEEPLTILIDRYLGSRQSQLAQWLLGRSAQELAVLIVPEWITAWDYSARMK